MINEDILTDIDTTKRKEEDWEKIYHIKITDGIIESSPIDEFEFAFYLQRKKYYLLPDKNNNFEKATEMENRAMKIYRDIYSTADRHEKILLKSGEFIKTQYILDYRLKHM